MGISKIHTVKLQAVNRATIQFWTLLDKGHITTLASNFPFINNMKILGFATTNQLYGNHSKLPIQCFIQPFPTINQSRFEKKP